MSMVTIKINGIEFTGTMEQAIEFTRATAGVSGTVATKGKGQAKSAPKEKNVAFTKRNGEVVMTTAKQAEAWKKSVERSDEYKKVAKEITAQGRAYVAANPGCTRKEAAANGCPHITKDELKALKVELGVRTAK